MTNTGVRIDGRVLSNALPEVRHDLKHIAFSQIKGHSRVLDHLVYGAYSTKAWDDFTYREGVLQGNLEEIFVRAMEVYLSMDASASQEAVRAAIEKDIQRSLADMPEDVFVSLEEGSEFRRAVNVYQRLNQQLDSEGEIRIIHTYAPRFLNPESMGRAGEDAAVLSNLSGPVVGQLKAPLWEIYDLFRLDRRTRIYLLKDEAFAWIRDFGSEAHKQVARAVLRDRKDLEADEVSHLLQLLVTTVVENAMDGYMQRVERDEVTDEDFTLQYEIVSKADAIHVRFVDNGMPQSISERTADKLVARVTGKRRLGGGGFALIDIPEYLKFFDATRLPVMYDRTDGKAGTVFEFSVPTRQALEDRPARRRMGLRRIDGEAAKDEAMSAENPVDHQEQRETAAKISAGLAANFTVPPGEPMFKDTQRVSAMAGMFPKTSSGERQAVATDIYGMAITDLPQTMRDYLRDVVVAEWLSIFDGAEQEIDHFIPARETYHVSVAVVQDVAASEDEAVGVLGRPGQKLTARQREKILAEIKQILNAKGSIHLSPVGARVGADGTLIMVFEYDPVLYEIRDETIRAIHANAENYTGRPKPLVHITLSRTLNNPTVTPMILSKLRRFEEKFAMISLADMGLTAPAQINRINYSHELRWMHTEVGASEDIELASRDQASVSEPSADDGALLSDRERAIVEGVKLDLFDPYFELSQLFPYSEESLNRIPQNNFGVSVRDRFVRSDGTLAPFYNVSLYSFPEQSGGVYRAFESIQNDFAALPFADRFYISPLNSVHLTLGPVLVPQRAEYDARELAGLPVRIDQLLADVAPFDVWIEGITIDETSGRILAQVFPLPNNASQDPHLKLKQALNENTTVGRTTITLAAPYQPLTDAERRQLVEWVRARRGLEIGRMRVSEGRLIHASDSFNVNRLSETVIPFGKTLDTKVPKILDISMDQAMTGQTRREIDWLSVDDLRQRFRDYAEQNKSRRKSLLNEWQQNERRRFRVSGTIVLRRVNGQWYFLMAERNSEKDRGKGLFTIPSGKLESDEDSLTAALRELHEEAGITSEKEDVVLQLDDLFGNKENILLHTFIVVQDQGNMDVDIGMLDEDGHPELTNFTWLRVDDFLKSPAAKESAVTVLLTQAHPERDVVLAPGFHESRLLRVLSGIFDNILQGDPDAAVLGDRHRAYRWNQSFPGLTKYSIEAVGDHSQSTARLHAVLYAPAVKDAGRADPLARFEGLLTTAQLANMRERLNTAVTDGEAAFIRKYEIELSNLHADQAVVADDDGKETRAGISGIQARLKTGIAFIFGTGNNGTVIDANGQILTEEGVLTELGHNILWRARSNTWVFTGRQTKGDRPEREAGDVSFEDSFSGPNIARQFSHESGATVTAETYIADLPEAFG
ncbi:MAG: NUDIX domain-containing protein, partial [Candidatus Omnitrophica bacterium]|nr:NUDIX domain-containing protein [Candidatus Omnitrophota bacterium]